MNACKRFFSSFDFFGEKNYLRYERRNSFQTACGGLISIFIILIFAAIILFKIYQNFYQTEEQIDVLEINNISMNPSLTKLNAQNFMFAVKIDQPDFISNPYFQISLYQKKIQNSVQSDLVIDMVPCTLNHFPSFQTEFSTYGLSDFLCPELTYNLQIQGSLGSNIYDYLNVRIEDCSIDTLNPGWTHTCKSPAEETNYLLTNRGFQVNFYHTDFQIQKSWIEPYKKYLSTFTNFKFHPVNFYQKVELFQSEYSINVQSSLHPVLEMLLGENKTVVNVIQNSHTIRQTEGQITGQSYAELVLRRSYLNVDYRVRFEKIGDFFSYLGGLIVILYLLFKIILGEYHQNRFLLEMAQKHYLCVMEEKASGNVKVTPLQKEKGIPDESSFSVKMKMFAEEIEKKKIQVTITLKYILYRMFCPCKCKTLPNDIKLLDNVRKKMAEDLDIVEIMDKINQIELIKKVLFDPKQRKVIELVKKQSITEQEYKEILTETQQHENQVSSLQSIIAPSQPSYIQPINTRLFEELDPKLQLILNQERIRLGEHEKTKKLIEQKHNQEKLILQNDSTELEGNKQQQNQKDGYFSDAQQSKLNQRIQKQQNTSMTQNLKGMIEKPQYSKQGTVDLNQSVNQGNPQQFKGVRRQNDQRFLQSQQVPQNQNEFRQQGQQNQNLDSTQRQFYKKQQQSGKKEQDAYRVVQPSQKNRQKEESFDDLDNSKQYLFNNDRDAQYYDKGSEVLESLRVFDENSPGFQKKQILMQQKQQYSNIQTLDDVQQEKNYKQRFDHIHREQKQQQIFPNQKFQEDEALEIAAMNSQRKRDEQIRIFQAKEGEIKKRSQSDEKNLEDKRIKQIIYGTPSPQKEQFNQRPLALARPNNFNQNQQEISQRENQNQKVYSQSPGINKNQYQNSETNSPLRKNYSPVKNNQNNNNNKINYMAQSEALNYEIIQPQRIDSDDSYKQHGRKAPRAHPLIIMDQNQNKYQ